LGTPAADQPQWGEAWSRNMVSGEKDLPASFDRQSRENFKWIAELGTETHSTPVIAGGRVYIGTNNGQPRDAKQEGDRGVLMCFDERTGEFLWQLVVPKREEDRYFDWPKCGISSPVTVEGDRVYLVSNRGEVMCLDARGMANGNDGPYRDEAKHMTPAGSNVMATGTMDADIVWLFDLTSGAGIWSHDAAHSSILIRGDHLYLNTGTGVDNTHKKIRAPDAPSLVVLDKHSGRYLAREREEMAPNIFHCTWSAPSMGEVDGRSLMFFAGGNGIVYAFEPLKTAATGADVATLRKVWQFDFDPTAPKENVHRYNQNRRESPSNFYGMPGDVEGAVRGRRGRADFIPEVLLAQQLLLAACRQDVELPLARPQVNFVVSHQRRSPDLPLDILRPNTGSRFRVHAMDLAPAIRNENQSIMHCRRGEHMPFQCV